MNRDEAREHFKKSGLSYSDITEEDITSLFHLLSDEFKTYKKTGGEHAESMDLKDIELSG